MLLIRFMIFCYCLIKTLTSGMNQYQKTTPQRFTVPEGKLQDVILSSIPLAIRLGSGAFVDGWTININQDKEELKSKYAVLQGLGLRIDETSTSIASNFMNRPQKTLELYEFEGCPFCKKVREVVTLLDLDVLFYPCPKGSPTYRAIVQKLGGKQQFPFLVDSNTGVSMYESDDIIQYLFDTYGPYGDVASSKNFKGMSTILSLSLSSLPRRGKGTTFDETKFKKDMKPLIFYGYEASPFCKIVRERLVELEIPHLQKTCGRGSSKRQELFEKTGRFQVPYLEDPNNDISLFESADIIDYLNEKYSV